MNSNSRFNIFAAVKNAYLFVGRERAYLFKTGLVPAAAQIACALFVQCQRPDASPVEAYLWSLPATLLLGWFLFLETRLLLLGERQESLPAEGAGGAARRKGLEASVAAFALFNMGVVAAFTALLYIEAFVQKAGAGGTAAGFVELLLIGALFWGVRLGIVPILAAVRYPVRAALRQTWGLMFSLRLIGMSILGVLPVMFLFQILLAAVFAGAPAPSGAGFSLTVGQQTLLNVIGAPMSLLASALLNAAGAYALKEILGRGQGKTP